MKEHYLIGLFAAFFILVASCIAFYVARASWLMFVSNGMGYISVPAEDVQQVRNIYRGRYENTYVVINKNGEEFFVVGRISDKWDDLTLLRNIFTRNYQGESRTSYTLITSLPEFFIRKVIGFVLFASFGIGFVYLIINRRYD